MQEIVDKFLSWYDTPPSPPLPRSLVIVIEGVLAYKIEGKKQSFTTLFISMFYGSNLVLRYPWSTKLGTRLNRFCTGRKFHFWPHYIPPRNWNFLNEVLNLFKKHELYIIFTFSVVLSTKKKEFSQRLKMLSLLESFQILLGHLWFYILMQDSVETTFYLENPRK